MSKTNLTGADFITWLDFSREEIDSILETAHDIKRRKIRGELHNHLLEAKSLFMLFYNTSLRTRNSFEAGMTQLGGHAHFLQPGAVYTPALEGDEEAYSTERVSDVAQVLSEMGEGIAIRIYGSHTNWRYGKGNKILEQFGHYASVPVINMEDDKFHPCQALADVMTMQEKLGPDLRGKKFTMSWAYSRSVEKPLSVPQSAIISAAIMGMDVTLARPKGLELDPEVIKATKDLSKRHGGNFNVTRDMEEGFEGAHVVYPKSWTVQPTDGSEADLDKARKIFEDNTDWIATSDLMDLTDDGLYMHCLPADRGTEVTDEVIDGPNSVVFDEAGNRLHAQKGLMSLLL